MKKTLIIYSLLIILLAVLPINKGESFLNNNYILHFRLDYLAHFAIFIPWMVISRIFCCRTGRRTALKILPWIGIGLALAILTEGVQYLLPYRAFNINDLAANILGVALGSLAFAFGKNKPEPQIQETGKSGLQEPKN